MDTPAEEPSSYSTFDTLCGLVFGLAVVVLAVGACLLLGALAAANAATELAVSLVGYGITCFSSGISLLIFSSGGLVFLDLARNNRLQVQKTDKILKHLAELNPRYEEILKHLAELNPRYEERLKREQEAAQRRAEVEWEAAQRKAEKERLDQEALARWRAEREQLDRERLAEEERQKAFAEEERQKALAAAAKAQENERQQRITDARNDAQIEFDEILAKWSVSQITSRIRQTFGRGRWTPQKSPARKGCRHARTEACSLYLP